MTQLLILLKKRIPQYLPLLIRYFFIFTIVLFSILISPSALSRVKAAGTVTWDGGASTSNWSDDNNWSDDEVPDETDDVVIDTAVTVDIAATTTINSLTLGDSGGGVASVLNFSYDAITNGALIIDDGDVITYSDSDITHSAGTASVVGTAFIDVQTGDFTNNGTIDINEKGYMGVTGGDGEGPGGGAMDCVSNHGGGGGAYGGNGGKGTGGSTNTSTYGSLTAPVDLGSAGGAGQYSGCNTIGGAGGGAIKLSVTGTLTVAGTISANGANGPSSTRGGGGSGGSIWIIAGNTVGGGDITANGGNGHVASTAGGGGGGGRIYVSYSGTDSYSGNFSVSGGTGAQAGETGSALWVNSSLNDLYIKTSQRLKAKHTDQRSLSYHSVVMSAGIIWYWDGYYTTNSDGIGSSLTASGDFTIPATSSIISDGYGYQGVTGGDGAGPGGGTYHCGGNQGGDGGAYGGNGGAGSGGSTNTETYGSSTAPIDLGSAGGAGYYGDCNTIGGDGGGAIKLSVTGTLTVAGTISANGANAPGNTRGGGGSGGSIWLIAENIEGDGDITANGGNGNVPNSGGGGGSGGRIAIYYLTDNSSITPTVTGGTGSVAGASGTSVSGIMNSAPTALASNLSGQEDIYAGKTYTISARYSDGDGAADLDDLYLQIQNPSATDIEYYATSAGSDQTGQTPTEVTGSAYVTAITYDIDYQSPTTEDITVTWYVTTDWDWTEDSDIEFGVKASDYEPSESSYNYTDNDYIYENDLTFTGTLSATGAVQGSLSSEDWVSASESITWTGLTVVYQGTVTEYPADASFDVQIIDDDIGSWTDTTSSGEAFSIVSTTDATTDTSDVHNINIIGIPSDGADASSQTFTIRVDDSTPDIVDITGANEDTWQSSDSGPEISWTDPTSPSDDTFYITNDGTVPTSGNYEYTTGLATYDLPDQGEGETTIRVRPLSGVGTYGSIYNFVIKYDTTAPTNVSGLAATAPSATSVKLDWTNPVESDFDHVLIQRSTSASPDSPSTGDTVYSGSAITVTDTGLSAETKYYYTVFAYDTLGNYSSGSTVSMTTLAVQADDDDSSSGAVLSSQTSSSSQAASSSQAGQAASVVSELIQELQEIIQEAEEIVVEEEEKIPFIFKVGGDEIDIKSGGNLHLFSGETVELNIPAEMLKKEETDINQVIVMIEQEAYVMKSSNDDLFYQAKFIAPQVLGAYTISAIVTYEDDSTSTISMNLEIDPYGYVYTMIKGQELRIKGAKVELYVKKDGEKTLWTTNTEEYSNPQFTNQQGEYSYFVEPGEYQLSITIEGYKEIVTDWFQVTDRALMKNIELKKVFNPMIVLYIIGSTVGFLFVFITVFKLLSSRLVGK